MCCSTWVAVLFNSNDSFHKLFHLLGGQKVSNVVLPFAHLCQLRGLVYGIRMYVHTNNNTHEIEIE